MLERSVMYEEVPLSRLRETDSTFIEEEKSAGVPTPLPLSIGCFRKHDGGRIVR